jgi:flagellar motor switch protein FliN/FliY
VTTTSTYNWLKHIPSALLRSDVNQNLGSIPSFPWESFSSKLAEIFPDKTIKIEAKNTAEWHKPEEFLNGFGTQPIPTYITLVPSLPSICWIMASEDIQFLMSALLNIEPETLKVIDPETKKGFQHFLTLEAVNALIQIDFDKTLSPQIQENQNLPHEDALCLDVSISLKQKTIWGRLIFTNAFRQSWKERYTPRTMDVPKPLLQHLNVTIACEAGRTTMKLTEWAKVNPGDFVVLDACSLKPSGEGRITLTLNGTPIFRGKLKDGNIKILEHPLYHEEEIVMEQTPNAGEDHEDDFDESDDELDDLDDISDEEEFVDSDEDLEELEADIEDEEVEDEEEEETEDEIPSEAISNETSTAQTSVPAQPQPLGTKKPFSPDDIPLSMVVEIGRIQMSLQKLMELQPGNLLELNVKPENGVDLVINGKRIAKGELLLVGEALGVRILDIG